MALVADVGKKLWELLKGYLLLGVRLTSIELHIGVLNDEIGGVEKKLEVLDARTDKIAEDVAYLRGRADR